MNWFWIFFPAAVPCLGGAGWWFWWMAGNPWPLTSRVRHARCLKNIARLERELAIGQPRRALPAPKEEWLIDRYGPVDPKTELARQLMARGLFYSAEYEAARQVFYPDDRQENA